MFPFYFVFMDDLVDKQNDYNKRVDNYCKSVDNYQRSALFDKKRRPLIIIVEMLKIFVKLLIIIIRETLL
jgi:hypothetical protein